MNELVFDYRTMEYSKHNVKQIKNKWYADFDGVWCKLFYGYVGARLVWIVTDQRGLNEMEYASEKAMEMFLEYVADLSRKIDMTSKGDKIIPDEALKEKAKEAVKEFLNEHTGNLKQQ